MDDKIYYKVIRIPGRTSIAAVDDKYYFKYPKKGKIRCNNNTLGFFMFETLQQAEKFTETLITQTIIIKVRCLAEVEKPVFVANLLYVNAFYYYYRICPIPTHLSAPPQDGTVCCEYIEILEDVGKGIAYELSG